MKIALVFSVLSPAPSPADDVVAAETELFVNLVEAARLGDTAGVERALQAGAEIDQVGDHAPWRIRFPALIHALEAGRDETAMLLIERGANVASRIEERAPLAWAAGFGRTRIAREIWARLPAAERGRLLEENDCWLRAVEHGHLDAVQELERLGFSLSGRDGGAAALHAAVASGRLDMLDHVLARKISPNGKTGGVTALARAAGRGRVQMMARLLATGAEIDAVSIRVPDTNARLELPVTALAVAVVKAEPEAAAVLLRGGADPAALDNLAIRWADLSGDAECFRLLRTAGAPEPVPFSFREWLPARAENDRGRRTGGASGPKLSALVAGAPLVETDGPLSMGRPAKLAVVPLSPGLEDAEAALVARLSQVAGAVLVERAEVRRITRERRLAQGFGAVPAENRRTGGLLGADALVLLRGDRQDGREVIETRVVGVASGLVVSLDRSERDKPDTITWADAAARRCVADAERIFIEPQDARLVALAPLSASTGGPVARETERRLTQLLAVQLARLPGVFLLERAELERLRAEPGALDETLLKSSWIIQGSVEVMGAQRDKAAENTLKLRLESARGVESELRVAGAATESPALATEAVDKIAGAMAVKTDVAWEPVREAELHFARGRAFAERKRWAEAQASAEIARALGMQGDEVTRALVEWSARRALRPFEVIDGDIYGVPKTPTLVDVFAERAPLLAPRRGDEDWTFGDYLAQAERMADWLASGLRRKDESFGGGDYEVWLAGPVWDAATLPLRLGEALSYRQEFGPEMDALRERLLALNDEALATAKEGGFRAAYHTLLGLRCRLLPWWLPDEAKFQAELLRVLHVARDERPAVAGHPVWGSVFRTGLAQMDVDCGATSQRWVRLARRLRESADAEERFLGLAWLSREEAAGKGGATSAVLREAFTELLEKDRAWTGRIWEIAHDMNRDPATRSPGEVGPWYGVAFRAATGEKWAGGWSTRRWDAGPAGMRPWPEEQAFDLASFERKATLIKEHGAACLLWHYGVRGEMSDEQVLRIMEALKLTLRVFAAARREHPEARNYFMDPTRWMQSFRRDLANSEARRRTAETPALAFGPPRWLWREGNAQEGATDFVEGYEMTYRGYQTGSEVWWLARRAGRVLIFRFDADGVPVDAVAHPAREGDSYFAIGEAWNRSVSGGGDVTARYVALQARDTDRRAPRYNNCVRLYDRVEKRWTTLTPPFPVNQIHDLRILGGRVYYSFLQNADIDREQAPLPGDFTRKGEPHWGIGEYDIGSAHHSLLVSGRRTPSETPLDQGGLELRELCALSSSTLAAGAAPEWVYDTGTGSWRKSTPAEAALIKKGRGQAVEIEAGGDTWIVSANSGRRITFQRKNLNRGKGAPMVSIPITMGAAATSAGAETEDAKLAERVAAAPYFHFHGTPHGIALSGPGFYAWAPLTEVSPVLEEAIRRMEKRAGAGNFK